MKTYKIPVVWQCWGMMHIEAESLEQALIEADSAPLPMGDYIDDSFEVDTDGIAMLDFNQPLSEEDQKFLDAHLPKDA